MQYLWVSTPITTPQMPQANMPIFKTPQEKNMHPDQVKMPSGRLIATS